MSADWARMIAVTMPLAGTQSETIHAHAITAFQVMVSLAMV